jgi:hypothetical protein
MSTRGEHASADKAWKMMKLVITLIFCTSCGAGERVRQASEPRTLLGMTSSPVATMSLANCSISADSQFLRFSRIQCRLEITGAGTR